MHYLGHVHVTNLNKKLGLMCVITNSHLGILVSQVFNLHLLLLVFVLLGMARMNQKEEILATRLRMLCYHHSGLVLMHSGKAMC